MFIEYLQQAWSSQQSLVCVGLDPDPDKLPACIKGHDRLLVFNREIVDATAKWCCAYKPQIAYYAAVGAEHQLAQTIAYIKRNYPHIPVILDAKRGDIGATALMYAREAFERYQADAVTVNPYMGGDSLEPFLKYSNKGVMILCRTSNPGSGDIQQLQSSGNSLAMTVAGLATNQWNGNRNVGLVVGATYPAEIARVRKVVGDMPLLIPGIGAQGGDLAAVLSAGLDRRKLGLIINSARNIIYASSGRDFADAAGGEAARLCLQINQLRH